MTNYIELHDCESGNRILVNLSKVNVLCEIETGGTRIFWTDGQFGDCKEGYDEVRAKMVLKQESQDEV